MHAGVRDRLELMPACPTEFPGEKLAGIRIHGGHKLDVAWKDGKLVAATLHVGNEETLTVVCAGMEPRTLKLKTGETRDLSPTAKP